MHDDMMNRSPDKHEAAMARADLYKLANYSMKLFKMIQEGQELEGWVQAKITKAADYVASVYHFMEYEMKASDYGSKLENSDVYSESVRRAFEQKLMEAKKQAAKVKKEADKVDEGFDDLEKYMKEKDKPKPSGGAGKKQGKAYGGSKQKDDDKEKDVKEGFPTVADAKARHEKEKGTGKFDKKKISTGTVYTRKANKDVEQDDEDTPKKNKKVREGGYYDPANDQPQKGSAASQAVAQRAAMAAAQPPKGVNFEKDYLEKAASGAPGRWMISADDAKTALTWLAANPNYKPPGGGKGVQEAAKPDYLDFDKDGNKKEPMKKALKDKKVKEGAGCNQTMEGKNCPTHGLKECPMSEAKNLKQQAAIAIAKKKAK